MFASMQLSKREEGLYLYCIASRSYPVVYVILIKKNVSCTFHVSKWLMREEGHDFMYICTQCYVLFYPYVIKTVQL